jgi:Na+-transporting NADH:ubiquinone oxidoreductase subunit NqrB
MAHATWLALLLALALPPHLGTLAGAHSPRAAFWLLPAAGMLIAIALWVLRGVAGTALHPVVVAYLVLVPIGHQLLVPHHVLQREHLFVGDVLDAPAEAAPAGANPWWFTRGRTAGHAAIRAVPASESLLAYTLGRRELGERGVMLLPGLLRDRLPPLEDLVMAGNPGPIGTSSVIFVIVGGLFLLYRGVIDYRIPLLIVASAFVALLVLPIPVAITDIGPRWSWLAMREPSVGWAVAITFANYQLAASPLMFTAFFLATSPTVRPITRRGRTIYAIAIGVVAAVMQLYISVSWGPYAALLLVGLFAPVADWFFQPRPLA